MIFRLRNVILYSNVLIYFLCFCRKRLLCVRIYHRSSMAISFGFFVRCDIKRFRIARFSISTLPFSNYSLAFAVVFVIRRSLRPSAYVVDLSVEVIVQFVNIVFKTRARYTSLFPITAPQARPSNPICFLVVSG